MRLFAQKVWSLAPFTETLDVSGMIDLVTHWENLCAKPCLPPAGILSNSLVPWILWALWKSRNCFVFEGFSVSPEDTLSSAIVLAREWKTDHKPENSNLVKVLQKEISSPGNTIMVRTDAAWSPFRNSAGFGWVIMTPNHHKSFKDHTDFLASPLLAEGLALREATLACKRMELLNTLRFESDYAQLIKAINSGTGGVELYGIVFDILAIAAEFEFVVFVWIPRERNIMADRLAKEAFCVSETLVVDGELNAPN